MFLRPEAIKIAHPLCYPFPTARQCRDPLSHSAMMPTHCCESQFGILGFLHLPVSPPRGRRYVGYSPNRRTRIYPTFSVLKGARNGRAYIPPPHYVTGSLKKREPDGNGKMEIKRRNVNTYYVFSR